MLALLSTILMVSIASFVVYGTFFETKWFDRFLDTLMNKAIHYLRFK